VDIHEELALDVLGRKSTEASGIMLASGLHANLGGGDVLDFIEDHAAGLGDPEQAHNRCNDGQKTQELPIGAWEVEDVVVLHALGLVAEDCIWPLLLLGAIWCW
jgi:hypothetical protein